MCSIKILIVEDNEGDLQTCRDTIKRYEREKDRQIQFVESTSVEDFPCKIDNTFDGAIIDLNLNDDWEAGNSVIEKIQRAYRIPVAIFTGSPSKASDEFNYIGIFKKGEYGYDYLLDLFFEVYKTGLTKIIGGRGKIEATMNTVFWNNILPQLDSWKSHIDDGKETENALLRFTLNHLMELLDDDTEKCFPEEMYIIPPFSDKLKTGSIVKDSTNDIFYVVLNPACDLALRVDGNMNTDRILICEIEKFKPIIDMVLQGYTKKDKKRKKVIELLKNNYSNYYHWLPKTKGFRGGIINFRKATTFPKETFSKQFINYKIKISSHFVKDIVSRYSGYYARQGQPDFDFEKLSEKIIPES